MTEIYTIPILKDNYAYVLRSADGCVAVIDAGEAPPVIDFLKARGWTPDYIISTHHHWDHVDGNPALKAEYGAPVIVPKNDAHKIAAYDRLMQDGDILEIGAMRLHAIETTGHTRGHICLWLPEDKILLSADTLFSMGCGRLIDGNAEEMFESFQKIAALPDDTMIYCGHEYTIVNGNFAVSIMPDNKDIAERMEQVENLRAQGLPTIPVALAVEKKTNPFLLARNAEDFALYRERRNRF